MFFILLYSLSSQHNNVKNLLKFTTYNEFIGLEVFFFVLIFSVVLLVTAATKGLLHQPRIIGDDDF
jgi:hypothetical protein